MKRFILIILILLGALTLLTFGQVNRNLDEIDAQIKNGRFSPITMNKKMMQREIDSLGKVYNVEAIGYTKTIIRNRETMILYYIGNKGELKEALLYTRWINF